MNTVNLPVSTIERVEKKFRAVLEELSELKKGKNKKKASKSKKPARFWTEAEWEKAEEEADEDIKAGRVYRLNKVEDLDKPLSELVNDNQRNSQV